MPRSISVTRRRLNLVDLSIRLRDGVVGFEFAAAVNFDTAFALFETVPNGGLQVLDTATYRSVDVPVPGSQHRGVCRFVFDPDMYTIAVPAVADSVPFFIQVTPVLASGAPGTAEAMHLIMPYNPVPFRAIVLHGTVPAGADITASLEIQLPMQCNDFQISNDGGNNLYVAYDRFGAEFGIQPVTTIFKTMEQRTTSVTQIFVRGENGGGGTEMNATFTLRNNPLGL